MVKLSFSLWLYKVLGDTSRLWFCKSKLIDGWMDFKARRERRSAV